MRMRDESWTVPAGIAALRGLSWAGGRTEVNPSENIPCAALRFLATPAIVTNAVEATPGKTTPSVKKDEST